MQHPFRAEFVGTLAVLGLMALVLGILWFDGSL